MYLTIADGVDSQGGIMQAQDSIPHSLRRLRAHAHHKLAEFYDRLSSSRARRVRLKTGSICKVARHKQLRQGYRQF